MLGWLKTPPNLLKSFVDNRVAEIQSLTETYQWRHVNTQDNPTDLLHNTWWNGPSWLFLDENKWPDLPFISSSSLPELRKTFSVLPCNNLYPWNNFSHFTRIQSVTAYILRVLNNCRPTNKNSIFISVDELNSSFSLLVKLSQKESYSSDLYILKQNKNVRSKSIILNLNPFLDENGIIRVGGRLKNSSNPIKNTLFCYLRSIIDFSGISCHFYTVVQD